MNFSKDKPDPQWPEEIKKAYESLKVPSLYDSLLANEKLTLEIHKQNREIKELADKIQDLSGKLQSALNILKEVEVEDYDEEGELLEERETPSSAHLIPFPEDYSEEDTNFFSEMDDLQKALDILLDTNDLIVELSKKTKQTTQQLMETLPKKEGLFKQIPPWNKFAENLTYHLSHDLDTARYALANYLEEMDIHSIDPQPGDLYASDKHHVLEKIAGGQPGTVALLVKKGYEQSNEVLRLAEVVIYI